VDRRTGPALALVVALAGASLGLAPAAGAFDDVPDGFVSGTPHVLRVRPIVGRVPSAPKRPIRPAAARRAATSVASRDLARVRAIVALPSTSRADDVSTSCVVNGRAGGGRKQVRYLLGPARLTGSDIVSVSLRRERGAKKARPVFVAEMTLRDRAAPALDAEPSTAILATVIDGKVVAGTLLAGNDPARIDDRPVMTLAAKGRGWSRDAAQDVVERIDQARSEEVIGFARQLTMTDHARAIYAANAPRIDDKARFAHDCPIPDSRGSYVLGCQGDERIFLLRVDRPDLAPIMPVTAAHEMLHAAYTRLDRSERTRINRLLDEYFAASTDQRLRDTVAEYEELEPGERHNELHSLLGTEVAELSRPLEQYYRRYFRDRSTIVDTFNGYQSIFDTIEAQYVQLEGELDALHVQLTDLEAQVEAADAEGARLGAQIDELRRQDRIEESNRLVGSQNAAVNRARSLATQYDALVADYNSKVDALNALAVTSHEIDVALEVEDPSP
jgi:hypothetical protein